jgi:cytochrome c biogenesis protein
MLHRIALILLVLLPASTLLWAVSPPEVSGTVASVWFPMLLLGLSCSLIVSVLVRLRRRLRTQRIPEAPSECISFEVSCPPADLLKTAERTFRGLVVVRRERCGGTESVLVDGRAGIWGSLLFHAGIVTVLAGSALGILFGLDGVLLLTEGERFTFGGRAIPHQRAGVLAHMMNADHFDVRLDRFEDRRPVGDVFAQASTVTCSARDGSETLDIRINHGSMFRGIRLHQADSWGYSPDVRLFRDGRPLLHAFVRLASPKQPADGLGRDHVTLADGTVVDLRLQAASARSAYGATRSVDGLVLLVSVRPPDGTRTECTLLPGESTRSGNITAAFPSLRKWTQLAVSRDPGVPVLTAGCALALIGLALRLFFVRRTIWLRVTPQGGGACLRVSGKTERYPDAFRAALAQDARRVQVEIPQHAADPPITLLPV